jgi:hypothetical protein
MWASRRARSTTIRLANRAQHRQIAGQRGRHSQHQPGVARIGQVRHDRFEDQHGGHIADDVRQNGCPGAEHRGTLKMEARGRRQQVPRERRPLQRRRPPQTGQ